MLYYLAYARHITHQSLCKPAYALNSIFPALTKLEPNEDSDDQTELSEPKPKKQKIKKQSTKHDIYSSEYEEPEKEKFD